MKKGTKKRKGRRASTFLTKSLEEINNEIKQNYGRITGMDKLWQTYNKVTPTEAEACYDKYKGRCAYCDKSLSYLGSVSVYSARLAWYVPLNVGGEARPDNLIVVCARCKHGYTSTRKVRQDIVGLDSFADTIESLVKAVWAGEGPEVTLPLKDKLNVRLADVANCMRYVTTSDWKPEFDYTTGKKFVKIVEGENTIGEQVEQLAEGTRDGGDVKDEIIQVTKQIVTTKQYKIIRGPTNE
jgi:hypothetical protein